MCIETFKNNNFIYIHFYVASLTLSFGVSNCNMWNVSNNTLISINAVLLCKNLH